MKAGEHTDGPAADDSRHELSFAQAAKLVAVPLAAALALTATTPQMSRLVGVDEATLDLTLNPMLTNTVTLATMAALLHRNGRRLTPSTIGLWPVRWARASGWRRYATPVAIALLAALTASPWRERSIDFVWDLFAGPDWSVNSTPDILAGRFPVEVTPGLVLFQLAIRQPFTVVVEEAFTQGFLYERLGTWAPLKVGLLRALYHGFMWWSVPAIIPYSVAISLLRWYTGNPWSGIALHYGTNATYFLTMLGS